MNSAPTRRPRTSSASATASPQLGQGGQDNPALIAAEAQLEKAQLDLAGPQVVAPHLGVVTNLTLSPGQFASTGTPALTLSTPRRPGSRRTCARTSRATSIRATRRSCCSTPARESCSRAGCKASPGASTPATAGRGGLVVNQPASRWFEPAGRIPARIELTGGMERWPRDVPVGGKATVTVLAEPGGPVGWLARATMRLRSVASYLH